MRIVAKLIFTLLFLAPTYSFSQLYPFQGTYEWHHGKMPDGAFGFLQIHYVDSATILFYFEGGRGAPSYNGGSKYGRLKINHTNNTLEYLPRDEDDCRLEIRKAKKTITIKTIRGDCGFGYGVEANGSFKRTKKSNPKYFIDRKGHKIQFNNPTPENYLF